jgi:hypothetical protein
MKKLYAQEPRDTYREFEYDSHFVTAQLVPQPSGMDSTRFGVAVLRGSKLDKKCRAQSERAILKTGNAYFVRGSFSRM